MTFDNLSRRVARGRSMGAKRWLEIAVCVALASGLTGAQGLEASTVAYIPSRPDLRPPELTVDTAEPAPGSPHIFVAPWRGDGQAGPMILDEQGELVWFHPMPHSRKATDFRAQRYHGRPVLTWWEGHFDPDGFGRGHYIIANQSYQRIARFRSGDGHLGDLHEFVITPRDTALITIYRPVPYDLSPLGGPEHGTVLEAIVREVDIDTGRVLLDWHALDHVSLTESHEPVSSDGDELYDFFHVNSIDVDHDGNLLVSARHTDTVYKIDRQTGEVIWRLGGKRSDFTMGPGARFFSQHDARRQPDGTLTLFDNSNPPQKRDSSRAIILRLDMRRMRATLEQSFEHPLGLSSISQANAQALPGGDMFVGWGSQPYFSRFNANGDLEFDAHFPDDTDVYRSYQLPWKGDPPGVPAIDTEVANGEVSVRASWNGATEVARWQLLAGPTADRLRPVTSAAWEGFETTLRTDMDEGKVAVRAISESGEPLARSREITIGR